MDPDQTYEDFVSALQRGDIETASHHADDLACWLSRGGCVPARLQGRCSSGPELVRFLTGATVVLAWAARDLAVEPDEGGP